ncbi:MAG: DUF2127 domain-containing protein [Verrucomicrobiota bacterium]|nr:DUF2127 domain-containing protein [Verrucomicrobiota bacterium]
MPEEKKQIAPTFYVIIGLKLVKGALFLSMALTAYALANNDLPEIYQNLLQWLRLNPEKKFFTDLAVQVGKLTEARVLWVAAGTLVYSLFSLVEGIGLIFRVSWAGWLAIGESAFFIPIEIFELIHGYSTSVFLILLFNIFIVWYLFQNRARLFRHHH